MKYCTHCGKEIADEAVICPGCGCAVSSEVQLSTAKQNADALNIAIKVFMLLGLLASAALLIPLCWTIPMTVHVFKKLGKEPIGVGFKICALLFCNLIAGILLLVSEE